MSLAETEEHSKDGIWGEKTQAKLVLYQGNYDS